MRRARVRTIRSTRPSSVERRRIQARGPATRASRRRGDNDIPNQNSPRRSRRRATPRNQDRNDNRAREDRDRDGGPERGFDSFRFSSDIRRGIEAAGFDEPRPIQAAAIPAVLDGRDVLGLAQTGTGKTAAFVLPILEHLTQDRPRGRRRGPRALIVAPTRELAIQIHSDVETLGRFTPITSTTVFGGVNQNPQVRALRAGPDVVVACPGRLLDLRQQGEVDLGGVEVLVLDEADHMFDLGFLPSVKKIVAACPDQRQNLLFSATMPREIRGLADRVLHKPEVVELSHSAPAETIEHALYPCAEDKKQDLLEHLLDADDFTSAIVFLRTKHRAKRLAQKLDRKGHAAVALQGNMSQNQRQKAMQGFRDGTYDVLVATDIAARGIDVADVSHVINFDVPLTPDAYTHRIGRTGRAERAGQAMTFITNNDYDQVRAIERRLGTAIQRVRLEGFGGERRRGENQGGARSREVERERNRGGGGGGRGRGRSRASESAARAGASSDGGRRRRGGGRSSQKASAAPERAPSKRRTKAAPPRAAAGSAPRANQAEKKAPARSKPGPSFGAGIN